MRIDNSSLLKMDFAFLKNLIGSEVKIKTKTNIKYFNFDSNELIGIIVEFLDAWNHPNLPGAIIISVRTVEPDLVLTVKDNTKKTIYFSQIEYIEIIEG